MWIICLCQMWEQQLIKFLVNEKQKYGLKCYPDDVKKDFGFIEKAYRNHGVEFEKLTNWKKINELRQLVNTLKHADGKSANTLREMRPDYFDWGDSDFSSDTLKLYGSTLLDETLKMNIQDFKDYLDALVAFWNELPENMTWRGKLD